MCAIPVPRNAVGRQKLADHQARRQQRIERELARMKNPVALTLWVRRGISAFKRAYHKATTEVTLP